MNVTIKLFSEITIKSRPVRRQLTRRLARNIRRSLASLDENLVLRESWDHLTLTVSEEGQTNWEALAKRLQRIAGISHFAPSTETALCEFEGIARQVLALHGEALTGQRFVVRVRRRGQHDFSSVDLERYLGGCILRSCDGTKVALKDPDYTVNLEIKKDRLMILGRRYEGLGGYPIGGIESAVVLLSGGYDSAIAAYLSMKRGIRCHFLFFNLGGAAHEAAVQEVAQWLWHQYGSACRVRFVSVPFGAVADAINRDVRPRNRGVVLKRLMLKVADQVAQQLHVSALVTGESVSQVASQTLTNLSLIDKACPQVILRPLVTLNKEDIVAQAREIGIMPLVEGAPEYCATIAERPGAKGREGKVLFSESKVSDALVEAAWQAATLCHIDELIKPESSDAAAGREPVVYSDLPPDVVIIDVRASHEVALAPLALPETPVLCIPYYELLSRVSELDTTRLHLLYCDQGRMSRLQAAHLMRQENYEGPELGLFQPDQA